MHRLHAGCDRIHHRSIQARGNGPAADELRPQHDADVGLVPGLPEANARQSLDLSAVAPRGRVREVPELHGIGPERHLVDLGVSGIGPLRRAVDRHERLQPSLGDRRDLAVEVFPVVGGVVGSRALKSGRFRAAPAGATVRQLRKSLSVLAPDARTRRSVRPLSSMNGSAGKNAVSSGPAPVRVAGEDAGTGSEDEEREQPREDGCAAAHAQLSVVT